MERVSVSHRPSPDRSSRAARRLTALALAVALGGTTLLAPATADDRAGAHSHQRGPGSADGAGSTRLGVPRHSSDSALDDLSPRLRTTGCTGPRRKIDRSWRVARGIKARKWDRTDGDGNPMRVSLLTVNLADRRIRFDYIGPRIIGNTRTTSSYAEWQGATAAVNADFFDISDTGAPLGIGIESGSGLLHGTKDGWVPELGYQPAFWLRDGKAQIGELWTRVRMTQHPRWRLDAVNAPLVRKDDIGVYTRKWGSTSGVSVTDGEQGREVVIEKGRVVRNRRGLSANLKIRQAVLVGRGDRARQLRSLEVGQRVTLRTRVGPVRPDVAISGDRPILEDGRTVVVNDTIKAPRTAVGIDRDARRLHLLVVDGRQRSSCGATMVELARLMRGLGDDVALNFDGGGSSTMFARRAGGERGVINSPSDGSEREVANVLGVFRRR